MQASLIYQRQFNEKLWSLEWDHATNINIGTIIVFFLFKVSRKLVKSIILIISKLILFIEQIIKKKKKIFDTQGLYPGRLAAISLLLS